MSKTFVMVHGAWHGAWAWDSLVSVLKQQNRNVVCLDSPSSGSEISALGNLQADVDNVINCLDKTDGQKILVSNKAYASGLKSPSNLKGRSFGLTQTGSSFHYMASQIAKKEGFSSKEMSLKPLQKVGAIIGALKSGQIDAWSIVPHIAKALDKSGGAKIIGDVADYIDGYQITTIFTSKNVSLS